jgi:hypothetical protein
MTRDRADGVDDYLGAATVSFVGRDAFERARSRRQACFFRPGESESEVGVAWSLATWGGNQHPVVQAKKMYS